MLPLFQIIIPNNAWSERPYPKSRKLYIKLRRPRIRDKPRQTCINRHTRIRAGTQCHSIVRAIRHRIINIDGGSGDAFSASPSHGNHALPYLGTVEYVFRLVQQAAVGSFVQELKWNIGWVRGVECAWDIDTTGFVERFA
jgi:hypothetical protein